MSLAQSKVIPSCQFVVQNAQDVKINDGSCIQAADSIYKAMQLNEYSTGSWSKHPLNPNVKDVSTVDWIFTVDLLNFSFWSDIDANDTGDAQASHRYAVEYHGLHTGYWSLVAAINRALEEGIPITSPRYWISSDLTIKQLQHIFRSATSESIPLLEDRLSVLKEAGQVITDLYAGSASNIIVQSNSSAVKVVDLLAQHFNSFDDTALYKGRKVYLLKRAQIFVSDVWACFEGKSYGKFRDIDQITMFADYRVPQILHSLGCIEYSPRLIQHLKDLEPIAKGHQWELELRAASIIAVETINRYINSQHPDSKVNSILIDFYLWDTAKQRQKELNGNGDQIPCHRTRSVYY